MKILTKKEKLDAIAIANKWHKSKAGRKAIARIAQNSEDDVKRLTPKTRSLDDPYYQPMTI